MFMKEYDITTDTTMDYGEKAVRYITIIIFYELLLYAFVNIFVLKYVPAGMALLGLASGTLFNYSFIRLEKMYIAKANLMIISTCQVSLTSYVFFERDTGFFMYYFIIIPLAFVLFDYSKKIDRYVLISVIIVVSLLFMFSNSPIFDEYKRSFSKLTTSILFQTGSVSSLVGVASFLWMYAIDVYEKRLALDKLANTDPLTGILNRRRFFELANDFFEDLVEKKEKHTLLILDIDFFKKINDHYGHPSGDKILKDLSKVISENIRHNDVFARYGGEEFAIIFRGSLLKDGVYRGEVIRELIATYPFELFDKEIEVTISIGVAEMNDASDNLDSIIQVADSCLYRAKELGKNRVEF